MNARSVAYTDPKAGGSDGIMFSALLEKLGIAEAINKKAVLGKSGHDVTTSIAEGRAEIGTTFISEVLPVKGARVVGPLPGELHIANTYRQLFMLRRVRAQVPKPCCASLAIRQLVLAGLLQAWSPLFRIIKDLARRHGFT
ncbi:MAG: substrate-binding domain-containing protein [Pseudolabrys sp.]